MKKIILTIIFGSLSALIVILAISVSIKSQLSNPTIQELNTKAWKESGPLELSPERGRYALLFSLVENKSFQFNTEVARLATPDLGYSNGKFVSLFAPGTSILMIPGYLIGKYFNASHLGATVTIGVFAVLNVLLIYLILKKLTVSRLIAYTSALLFLVATPALTYAGIIYQHHISTFTVLLSLYISLHKNSIWQLISIFLIFGFSALIDVPNVFFITPILLFVLVKHFRFIKSHTGINFVVNPNIFLAAFSICIPIFMYFAINYYSYGNVLQLSNTVTHIQALDEKGQAIVGRGADQRSVSDIQNLGERKRSAFNFFKSRHLINGLYAFSISPDRGTIVFTPIVLLGFLGFVQLRKKNKWFAQIFLGIICFNILLYSMRSDPWGGWGFGSRYLIPSYSILAILIGLTIERYRKNILFLIIFLIISSYSIYVNVAGAISSTANPPQVEILSLEALSGSRERYSFDRNIEYLKNGGSKSLVYQQYFKNSVTPWEYYRLISGSLVGLICLLTIFVYLRRNYL